MSAWERDYHYCDHPNNRFKFHDWNGKHNGVIHDYGVWGIYYTGAGLFFRSLSGKCLLWMVAILRAEPRHRKIPLSINICGRK